MATGPGGLELTDEGLAGLTDAELVELRHSVTAEVEPLRPIMDELFESLNPFPANMPQISASIQQTLLLVEIRRQALSRPLTENEERVLKCCEMQRRINGEVSRRLDEMLRGARIALGLTLRDVAKAAGIHSKFVEKTEQGLRGSMTSSDLFERACTEGRLAKADFTLSLSLWSPIADPQICRTIRKVAVDVDRDWLARNNGSAGDLARLIFFERSLHLLPILGDALEEAGCSDSAILAHCRKPGLHARGCWVVDALVRAGRPG